MDAPYALDSLAVHINTHAAYRGWHRAVALGIVRSQGSRDQMCEAPVCIGCWASVSLFRDLSLSHSSS